MDRSANVALAGGFCAVAIALLGSLGTNVMENRVHNLEAKCRTSDGDRNHATTSESTAQPPSEVQEFRERFNAEKAAGAASATGSLSDREARELVSLVTKRARASVATRPIRADLYQALRLADKLGDSVSAREIAVYVEALPNEGADLRQFRVATNVFNQFDPMPTAMASSSFDPSTARPVVDAAQAVPEPAQDRDETTPAWSRAPLVCGERELAVSSQTGLVGIQRDIVQAQLGVNVLDRWSQPLAIAAFALGTVPWLWYFLLRRIREFRDAVAGK